MNKKIELSKEKQEHMISMIKDYFRKERDEELGDLAAMLILDFFMESWLLKSIIRVFMIHTNISQKR